MFFTFTLSKLDKLHKVFLLFTLMEYIRRDLNYYTICNGYLANINFILIKSMHVYYTINPKNAIYGAMLDGNVNAVKHCINLGATKYNKYLLYAIKYSPTFVELFKKLDTEEFNKNILYGNLNEIYYIRREQLTKYLEFAVLHDNLQLIESLIAEYDLYEDLFVYAARYGKCSIIRSLMPQPISPIIKRKAAIAAVTGDHIRILKKLINYGADNFESLAIEAIRCDNSVILEYLMPKITTYDELLNIAIQENNDPLIAQLRNMGANKNSNTLASAVIADDILLFDFLFEDASIEELNSAADAAAASYNTHYMERILSTGITFDCSYIAAQNSISIVRLLINYDNAATIIDAIYNAANTNNEINCIYYIDVVKEMYKARDIYPYDDTIQHTLYNKYNLFMYIDISLTDLIQIYKSAMEGAIAGGHKALFAKLYELFQSEYIDDFNIDDLLNMAVGNYDMINFLKRILN